MLLFSADKLKFLLPTDDISIQFTDDVNYVYSMLIIAKENPTRDIK